MAGPIVELKPHPAHAGTAIRRIEATIALTSNFAQLRFTFRADGEMGRLRLQSPATALRADGLWQHTCFEAFLRPDDGDTYYELNFSPRGAWQVYRFARRRASRKLPPVSTPRIQFRSDDGACDMSAVVSLASLPGIARAKRIHTGLAAVIEERDGTLGYWALAHRARQPDFHDPVTFTLALPVA